MFGWFKKKLTPATADEQAARFMTRFATLAPNPSDLQDTPEQAARFAAHFAAAEGTHIQRGAIAAALSAVENDFVQKQFISLTTKDQTIFMIAYGCFVMWALKEGIEKVLQQDEVRSACGAIQGSFAKYAWYQPVVFEKISRQMHEFFALAMTWDHGGQPPITFVEVSMAAQQAGYPFKHIPLASFIVYVSLEVERLAAIGRLVAKQHLSLNGT